MNPIRTIRRLYYLFFVRYRRLELVFVTWSKAISLMQGPMNIPESSVWHIAKEEDTNKNPFMVYLERKERIRE